MSYFSIDLSSTTNYGEIGFDDLELEPISGNWNFSEIGPLPTDRVAQWTAKQIFVELFYE